MWYITEFLVWGCFNLSASYCLTLYESFQFADLVLTQTNLLLYAAYKHTHTHTNTLLLLIFCSCLLLLNISSVKARVHKLFQLFAWGPSEPDLRQIMCQHNHTVEMAQCFGLNLFQIQHGIFQMDKQTRQPVSACRLDWNEVRPEFIRDGNFWVEMLNTLTFPLLLPVGFSCIMWQPGHLTLSLPWCCLKMTNKSALSEILRPFSFLFHINVKGFSSKCITIKAEC